MTAICGFDDSSSSDWVPLRVAAGALSSNSLFTPPSTASQLQEWLGFFVFLLVNLQIRKVMDMITASTTTVAAITTTIITVVSFFSSSASVVAVSLSSRAVNKIRHNHIWCL